MNKSLRTMAIASLGGAMLLAASLAMAGDKPKSAANEGGFAAGAKKETKHRAYLGVAVEPLRSALWSHLRDVLQQRRGLLVTQVAKDSPAEKAGIEMDDILVTYGDQKLFTPEQLVGLVHADKAGHDVTLRIVRSGEWREVQLTLGEQSVAENARSFNWPKTFFGPTRQSPGALRFRHHPDVRHPSSAWHTGQSGNTRWDSFDSLTLKSLGDNRFKVEISYETKDGSVEHRVFEGTREDIHRDIMAQKDLPASEREHLLRSLAMPETDLKFAFPGVYYSPAGPMIWDFGNLDSPYWPELPAEF